MNEINVKLKGIRDKLEQLLRQYLALQKENERLSTELKEKEAESLNKSQEILSLQNKVDALQVSSGKWNSVDRENIEKRIDVYLKEIEKCLELLHN